MDTNKLYHWLEKEKKKLKIAVAYQNGSVDKLKDRRLNERETKREENNQLKTI